MERRGNQRILPLRQPALAMVHGRAAALRFEVAGESDIGGGSGGEEGPAKATPDDPQGRHRPGGIRVQHRPRRADGASQ